MTGRLHHKHSPHRVRGWKFRIDENSNCKLKCIWSSKSYLGGKLKNSMLLVDSCVYHCYYLLQKVWKHGWGTSWEQESIMVNPRVNCLSHVFRCFPLRDDFANQSHFNIQIEFHLFLNLCREYHWVHGWNFIFSETRWGDCFSCRFPLYALYNIVAHNFVLMWQETFEWLSGYNIVKNVRLLDRNVS